MKTRTLLIGLVGSLTVASGSIMGGYYLSEPAVKPPVDNWDFKPEPDPDPPVLAAADSTKGIGPTDMQNLRWALFNRVCPSPGNWGDAVRQNCYELKSISCGGSNGCACLTFRQDAMPGEVNPASLPDCAYRRVGICKWNDNQARSQSQILVRPVGWTPPSGTTCSVIANRVLIWDTRENKKDALETALEARCGWQLPGGRWNCCPQCLLWANLCPPCLNLCTYGNAWKGHEAECNPGAT